MKKLTLVVSSLLFASSAMSSDLAEIFQQSEKHDPQLSVAKNTLAANTEGKKQAFSAFLPQVSAGWSKNKGDQNRSGSIIPESEFDIDDRSWNVSVNQSIYDHSNYVNYEIADLQVLLSEADYDVAYQDFLLRVAQSYFNVLAAKDSLVFSKAEEKAIKRQLDQAEQRFEVGLAAITDVHESRARYDGARASVILAQNQLEDSNEALYEMTQKYYDDLAIVPDDINLDSVKIDTLDAYQKIVEGKNPELAVAVLNKEIAEKRIALSKAGHYPTASLSLTKRNNLNPNATFPVTTSTGTTFVATDQTNETSVATLSVNVPIYSGGRTSSQVRQAVNNYEVSVDRYEIARRGAIRKVRNAYFGSSAAKSSINARKQAMVSAQSGLDATEAGYEVGTRTIVDVLNSQRSLYQAQRDYSKAKYDYFIQVLELNRSAGILVKENLLQINKVLN